MASRVVITVAAIESTGDYLFLTVVTPDQHPDLILRIPGSHFDA